MILQYLNLSKYVKTNLGALYWKPPINKYFSVVTYLATKASSTDSVHVHAAAVKTYPIGKLHHIKIGHGPHVVALLPGLFGSIQTDFQLLLPKLDKEKFTWISWDPPGYGKSIPPTRDFSGDFLRRDAHTFVKLMESLGYDKFSVAGWSMGGMTGALIGIDFPEKLNKLIAWGSYTRADAKSVIFGNSIRTVNGWTEEMRKALIAAHGGSKEYLEKMSNEWADANEESLKTFGCGSSAYEHLYHGIPKIEAPTLIIHGENDPMIGIDHAIHYHGHIKNSKFYLWPKGKHNIHLKQPDIFIKMMEHFLLTDQVLTKQ